ncbi:MAG: formate dehydrogenase [Limnohabitans sp.]
MEPTSTAKHSRRSLFGAAATVGAVAAASSVLPTAVKSLASTATPELPKPDKGGGYSLSEHVKRYYQTTRV